MSEFRPTAEQEQIIEAVATGENVVVTAVAGSGKTSTLRLIGDALAPKQGLYLAFGKDIQLEAEKTFPANVECRTAHSIAYAYGQKHFPALMRKMNNNPKPWDASKTLGIYGGQQFGERFMSDRALASQVNATVTKFCHTADTEISAKHVPYEFNGSDQTDFATFIVPFARKAWADITSNNGRLKFSFDHYLKLWSIDQPQLRADFILFDEAQDADPAIAHVIEAQQSQVIMVGDASQAIYGWRGAVDALSKFRATHRLTLTQSFRFGQPIADFANLLLDMIEAEVRVVGNPAKDSAVATTADPDAILCRTNAGVIEYAMMMQAQGKQVAIAGGTKDIESFVRAAMKLMAIEAGARGFVTHPELAGFESWSDVVAHAKEDDGSDIRVRVNLINQYGPQAILDVCANSTRMEDADVVISTAHKAKGLEWDRVKIGPDFKAPTEEGETPSKAELMLMYVAVTRAKVTLDSTTLSWVAAEMEVAA